jgi:hypothetical protein
MSRWIFGLLVFAGSGVHAQGGLSDQGIRELLVRQSVAAYSGACPCPENLMRNGRRCGRRSAYSRPGGASPLCYPQDVNRKMIEAYRASHK